jgi:hypothetical protein
MSLVLLGIYTNQFLQPLLEDRSAKTGSGTSSASWLKELANSARSRGLRTNLPWTGSEQTMSTRQIGAAAGIVCPAAFVVTLLFSGGIRPGYSVLSDYVSALSLTDRGWGQIASFVVIGVSFLLFALTLARDFVKLTVPLADPIALAVVGLGYLFSSPFVIDRQGTPPGIFSWHGLTHSLRGAMVFY